MRHSFQAVNSMAKAILRAYTITGAGAIRTSKDVVRATISGLLVFSFWILSRQHSNKLL